MLVVYCFDLPNENLISNVNPQNNYKLKLHMVVCELFSHLLAVAGGMKEEVIGVRLCQNILKDISIPFIYKLDKIAFQQKKGTYLLV